MLSNVRSIDRDPWDYLYLHINLICVHVRALLEPNLASMSGAAVSIALARAVPWREHSVSAIFVNTALLAVESSTRLMLS